MILGVIWCFVAGAAASSSFPVEKLSSVERLLMDQAALLQRIIDDSENDAPRLAFADFLAQNGQVARADWIRASVVLAPLHFGDPGWEAAINAERAAFGQCRPSWWESLSNIDQRNVRGLFRFKVGESRSSRGPTPIKRLGKAAWMGQAYAEGWLQAIDVLWADTELSQNLAAWKLPISRIPLFVRPAPQILDEGLRGILTLPQLDGLDLPSNVVACPVVQELSHYSKIRELVLEFRLVKDDIVDAVVEQLAHMAGLRMLHLKGHDRIDYGTRPNDSDLARISKNSSLRRLLLSDSPAVSDSAIKGLNRACPSLVVCRR